MSNQFDEYYGKYTKAAPLDSSDIMFPSSTGTSLSSRMNGIRTSSSPRVGLSWPEEEHIGRRSLSPLTYSFGNSPNERSFRVADSSPSERRRLVSELRMQARKVALKSSPPMRMSQSNLARETNGNGTNGDSSMLYGKRTFQTSIGDDRYRPTFDEPPSIERRRTTEEEAERELAELTRSTENLRKLGADIMSSTSAFMGQVQADRFQYGSSPNGQPQQRRQEIKAQPQLTPQQPFQPMFSQASAEPQSVLGTSAAYASQPSFIATSGSPSTQYVQQPMIYAQYQQASAPAPSAAYPQLIFVQSPSTIPGAPPQVFPIMLTTPPMMPLGSPPPPFSPVMSSSDSSSRNGLAAPTTAPVIVPAVSPHQASTQATQNVHSTATSAIPGGETVPSSKNTGKMEAQKAVTFQTAVEETKGDNSNSIPIPAIFEPSGQVKADVVPPAHVDLNALEDERARRKREFLAKRSQKESPAGKAMAEMASQAAELVSSRSLNTDDPNSVHSPSTSQVVINDTLKEDNLSPALGRSSSVPVTSLNTVEKSEQIRAKSELNLSNSAETNNGDNVTPLSEEERERAVRMVRLAEEANRLQATVDNTFAVVPFGVFLKAQGGSYDDADLKTSFKAVRPPPIIGKAGPLTGRRRARSTDDNIAGENSVTAPPSLISNPKERQPVMLQGYLMKTSGPKRPTQVRGSWQRRYFILSGRLLLYTSSQASSQVKRMIDLNKVDVVTDNIPELDGAPTPHCIGLMEFGEPRMLTICAESHAQILEWYKGIVQNCALLCENKLPQKSLPPTNKTKISEKEIWRKEMEQLHKSQLPVPPAPEIGWFYPIWQKPKSYYDLLGVPSDSTAGIIKKAYYRIAKDSHPDRSSRSIRNLDPNSPQNKSSSSAINPEEFAAIALAYETLIDPAKRAEYDLAEKVKEELRHGIDCFHLECQWSDEDLKLEPRVRLIRTVFKRRVTIFCDGELRCLYWQPAPEPEGPDGSTPLLPLSPSIERSIEMRFVQQILYFRDGPIDFGKNEPPPYDNEARFVVMGDRLHTGPLLFLMKDHQQCSELVHGLRVARCEKSMLFQQKLDSLRNAGVQ